METRNKSPTIKDPYLVDLVDKTIINMEKCYKKKDLDGMFNVGEAYGRLLTNYRLKNPDNEKEASKARIEVDLYWVFHKRI